jgi:hypothetical protein
VGPVRQDGILVCRLFPEGFFGAGWTHVVRHKGSLFSYNARTSAAAIGRLTGPQGFTQYHTYTTFALGWTHLAVTVDPLF